MENKKIKRWQKLAKLFHCFGTGKRNMIFLKMAGVVLCTGICVLGGALSFNVLVVFGGFCGLLACIDTVGEAMFRQGALFCDLVEKAYLDKIENEYKIENKFANQTELLKQQEKVVMETSKKFCQDRINFKNGNCFIDELATSAAKDSEEKLLLKTMQKIYKRNLKQARKGELQEDELVAPSINFEDYIQD